MHYIDIPSLNDVKKLAAQRSLVSLSFTIRTTPVTQDTQQDRTKFLNLAHDALQQIDDGRLSKNEFAALEAGLADIVEDDDFWAYQAESLAVFATPEKIRTYRLPNHLTDGFQISDRFHLTPLMRALAFPHNASVLVLGQNAVRAIALSGDRPAGELKIDGLPKDAASVARKASILGRSPKGRLQGSEGQKVHLLAFSRRIDEALRPHLIASAAPLVLVAHEPLRSVFLSVCSYDHVLHEQPEGVAAESSDMEIATASRALIDKYHQDVMASMRSQYSSQINNRRATDDISDIARLATFGGVDTLMVDLEAVVPGSIDPETGAVTYAEGSGPDSYDVLSEIASRTIQTGGKIYSVRQADLPGTTQIAAILRYPV